MQPILSITTAPQSGLIPLECNWLAAISKPYCFTIKVLSSIELEPAQWLQHPLGGIIQIADQQHPFHGIITSLQYERTEQHWHPYTFTIYPLLQTLCYDNYFEIFQNLSPPEILSQVLKRGQIPHRFHLTHTYSPLALCVQYNESSLNFIHRQLATWGLNYVFEQTDQQHTLIISDTLNQGPKQSLALSHSLQPNTPQLYKLNAHHCIGADYSAGSYYDYLSPQKNNRSQIAVDQSSQQQLTSYHYPLHTPNQLNQHKQHLQQQKSFYTGSSNALELTPGCTLSTRQSDTVPLTIIEIQHSVKDYSQHPQSHSDIPQHYHNEFIAIDAKSTQLDQGNYTIPKISGVQTATVTAPTQEINAQAQAQLNCHFPWAKERPYPIRNYYTQASQHYGHQYLARHQHQVVIHFINGDPEQPVINGALYNSTMQNAFAHRVNTPHNGLRSRTLGQHSQSGHEFSFYDRDGKENMLMHAAGTLSQSVQNNATIAIKGHYHQKIIHGDKTSSVDQGSHIIKANRILLQSGNSKIMMTDHGIHCQGVEIEFGNNNNGSDRKPLARLGDYHSCPKYEDQVLAHNGGKITEGSPNVFINGKPAARVNDKMHCDHSQDHISKGAAGLVINDLPAARKNDGSAHDGTITAGSSNVLTSH